MIRQLLGVTGQYASVDELLTATENLVLFARLQGVGRAESRRKAGELLEAFDLTEAANKPIKQFSGGMRRRLDLAVGQQRRDPVPGDRLAAPGHPVEEVQRRHEAGGTRSG